MLRQITNLEEVIPSKDVRDYVLNNHWIFEDYECFVLIQNSMLTMNRKYNLLYKLYNLIDNYELKRVINNYINYEQDKVRLFIDNTNANYILSIYDSEDEMYYENGVFTSLLLAKDFGEKQKKKFKIAKWKLNEINTTCEIGELFCNENGEYIDLWLNGYDSYDDSNFSYHKDMSIRMPNPFKRGDIVRFEDSYGVVETSVENWKHLQPYLSNHTAEMFDQSLVVELYKNNHFMHEHILPIYLNKVDIKKLDKKYNILKNVSSLFKGQESLDFFLIEYDSLK